MSIWDLLGAMDWYKNDDDDDDFDWSDYLDDEGNFHDDTWRD